MSPTLKKGIGLGYVNIGYDKIGEEIAVEIRGKNVCKGSLFAFYKKLQEK